MIVVAKCKENATYLFNLCFNGNRILNCSHNARELSMFRLDQKRLVNLGTLFGLVDV